MIIQLNESKSIFGISVDTLFIGVQKTIDYNDQLIVSLIPFATASAIRTGQNLSYNFEMKELIELYDEESGLPSGEYLKVPVEKDLGSISLFLGTESTANVFESVVSHLVLIEFLTSAENAILYGSTAFSDGFSDGFK